MSIYIQREVNQLIPFSSFSTFEKKSSLVNLFKTEINVSASSLLLNVKPLVNDYELNCIRNVKRYYEYKKLITFLILLSNVLGECIETKYLNLLISKLKKKTNISCFLKIEKNIFLAREETITILKRLPFYTLNLLEKTIEKKKLPIFFHHIFKISRLHKKLKQVKNISDLPYKDFILKEIAISFASIKNFKAAFDVTKMMLDLKNINLAYCGISIELAKNKLLKDASYVALAISDHYQKSIALRNISSVLVDVGDLAVALEIARLIPDSFQQDVAYKKISIGLALGNKIQLALSIANCIFDDLQRSFALKKIINILIKNECFILALKISDDIPDFFQRDNALMDIAVEYAKTDFFEEALEVVEKIDDLYIKDQALKFISVLSSKEFCF